MPPLRVAIVADGFWGWRAGRIYLLGLIEALASQPSPLEMTAVISSQLDDRNDLADLVAVIVHDPRSIRARAHARIDTTFRRVRPTFIDSPIRADIVFGNGMSHRLGKAAMIGNLLDYQDRHYPTLATPERLALRNAQEAVAVTRCAGLVFNSRWTLEDVARRTGGITAETAILPLLARVTKDELTLDPADTALEFSLPERFMIVASQLWAHKNHLELLNALGILKQRGSVPHLVFTGQKRDPRAPDHLGRINQRIDELGLRGSITILGEVEREKLLALMRRSLGFVQPTLHEGGGMPAEEARALGKPIVLANLPLQREADIPDALYFTPGDEESLAAAISGLADTSNPGPHEGREARAVELMATRRAKVGQEFLGLFTRVAAQK